MFDITETFVATDPKVEAALHRFACVADGLRRFEKERKATKGRGRGKKKGNTFWNLCRPPATQAMHRFVAGLLASEVKSSLV